MTDEQVQESRELLAELLIQHKEEVCNSYLSKVNKTHLETLVKLSESLKLETACFYSVSMAVEKTRKDLKDLTIGDFLEIVEEYNDFYKSITSPVNAQAEA